MFHITDAKLETAFENLKKNPNFSRKSARVYAGSSGLMIDFGLWIYAKSNLPDFYAAVYLVLSRVRMIDGKISVSTGFGRCFSKPAARTFSRSSAET